MTQPNIAKCYDDIVKDPSLLWLFLEKECTSLQELPPLGALWFRLISERLFTCIVSPDMWGKTRVGFITCTCQKISGEATPMAILLTGGIGEGNLGMETTFCHQDQVKIEASDALSALHQCNSPDPCVVVVRRYTNTPYIPWGTSCFLYLDMNTLYGALFHPISQWTSFIYTGYSISLRLRWSCLMKGGGGVKSVPPFPRGPMEKFRRGTPPLWSSFAVDPFICPPSHQEQGTQMEKELGYHPAFQQLQDFKQARVQLECELGQEAQKLAQKCNDHRIKLAKKHEKK